MGEIISVKALIAISLLTIIRGELKVTQVQVLFRHGDRTPRVKEMYPKDIHNVSKYEPWGLGQLTNTGKMREYKIGQVLKSRYQELLGSFYNPNSVYAISTDFDRTKMSLQLVLAGLFPPSEAQMWNSELPWIPIPVHYVPAELDIVMKPTRCPKFNKAVSKVRKLPEVQAKVAVYNDFFQFLTLKTGLKINKPNRVYKVHNLLVSQKAMNLTLPEWCTEEVLTSMGKVSALEYEAWSYTTKLRRINGGHMVIKFIENMHLDKTQENPRKIYLYSGHESTVAAFLRALGIVELKLPLYGTAVMVEKLRDTEGKLFIRIMLWTGVTEQLITLRLPNCEDVCPIERFLQLTREVIPSDKERDCHWRRLSADKLRSIIQDQMISNN